MGALAHFKLLLSLPHLYCTAVNGSLHASIIISSDAIILASVIKRNGLPLALCPAHSWCSVIVSVPPSLFIVTHTMSPEQHMGTMWSGSGCADGDLHLYDSICSVASNWLLERSNPSNKDPPFLHCTCHWIKMERKKDRALNVVAGAVLVKLEISFDLGFLIWEMSIITSMGIL